MPTRSEWEPPELYTHTDCGGIYHAYKDGSACRRLDYHFTTSDDPETEEEFVFDVRELPSYKAYMEKYYENQKAVLQLLARKGEIRFPETNKRYSDSNSVPCIGCGTFYNTDEEDFLCQHCEKYTVAGKTIAILLQKYKDRMPLAERLAAMLEGAQKRIADSKKSSALEDQEDA